MKLNEALYGAKRSAIREFSELAGRTPGCVALTLGEPDFATPQPICSAVTDALTTGQTHYIDNNGTRALREAVARFEHEKNGMDYTPDEVILTAGATEALFIALFGILNPGDEVIVPTPAFVLYEQIIGLCRGRYVPYDTGRVPVEREAVGIPDYTAYKGHPSELTEQSNWLYIQFAKPKGCP